MIIDQALFDSTSYGSARAILCKCDACGKERYVSKQKLVGRGDGLCKACHISALGASRRGTRHSSEARERISAATSGVKRPHLSADQRVNSSRKYVKSACLICFAESLRRADQLANWQGLCLSCAARTKAELPAMRERVCGSASRHWRGGVTPENARIRNSRESKQWRAAVLMRDGLACVACGAVGGKLEADHIKPFSLYPGLRFNIDNGRTLCKPCHGIHGAKVYDGRLIRPATIFTSLTGR